MTALFLVAGTLAVLHLRSNLSLGDFLNKAVDQIGVKGLVGIGLGTSLVTLAVLLTLFCLKNTKRKEVQVQQKNEEITPAQNPSVAIPLESITKTPASYDKSYFLKEGNFLVINDTQLFVREKGSKTPSIWTFSSKKERDAHLPNDCTCAAVNFRPLSENYFFQATELGKILLSKMASFQPLDCFYDPLLNMIYQYIGPSLGFKCVSFAFFSPTPTHLSFCDALGIKNTLNIQFIAPAQCLQIFNLYLSDENLAKGFLEKAHRIIYPGEFFKASSDNFYYKELLCSTLFNNPCQPENLKEITREQLFFRLNALASNSASANQPVSTEIVNNYKEGICLGEYEVVLQEESATFFMRDTNNEVLKRTFQSSEESLRELNALYLKGYTYKETFSKDTTHKAVALVEAIEKSGGLQENEFYCDITQHLIVYRGSEHLEWLLSKTLPEELKHCILISKEQQIKIAAALKEKKSNQ